jgi:CheY-like chemotaxis protein
MSRVLIIEDESVLRSSVARGISKLGIDVEEAGTLNDALELIDAGAPDLIISDIDMPERSGLELLGELGRRDLNIPIIFVSGYLNAYRSQIPHHASVEVLEKPVPIGELRAVVRRRLGDGSAAEVSPFGVPDYLQLACMGRHSVLIEVERNGNVVGEVVISSGDICSAKDDLGSGLEALGRLTFSEGALVKCRRLAENPSERDLEGGWEFLLMEAARVIDESRRSQELNAVSSDPGGPSSEPAASEEGASGERAPPRDGPGPHEEFSDLWDSGLEAMLSKNYPVALQVFEKALMLQPDDAKLKANIQRLHEMGFESVPVAREPDSNSDPNTEEEAVV